MGADGKSGNKVRNNFNLLLSVSFLFISVFALNLNILHPGDLRGSNYVDDNRSGVGSEKKVLAYSVNPPEFMGGESMNLSAKSVLAVDLESGAILYEKNSQDPVLPASTAKVISALVSLDAYELDQWLTVPKITVEGQKIGLKEGENLRFGDILYALLVASANDAAEVLADNYPGGRELFVANMNIKARNLGLKNSIFLNPTGLDETGQVTTSQDMVKAAFYAMQNPVFAKIVATEKYSILGEDGLVKYRLSNINQLLGTVEGVKGVKTGKTDGAMENLVTYIERGNAKIMIAILGSSDRFGETVTLIDWLFSNFLWEV